MKKLIKIFTLVLTLMFVVFLTACKGGKKTTKPVKVTSITAEKTTVPTVEAGIRMAKLSAGPMVLYDEPTTVAAEADSEGINYFVIYKSDHKVTLTIIVDNPSAVEVDMLKITSTDTGAKIKTYINNEETWESITDSGYTVKWNGSNAYSTRYDIETVSDGDCQFAVTDIKVNGSWQGEAGNKNKLNVYKMEDNSIKTTVISNTPSECTFTVEAENENVVIKGVTLNLEAIAVKDGKYIATESGEYIIEYVYKYDNTHTSETLKDSLKIELIHINSGIRLLSFGANGESHTGLLYLEGYVSGNDAEENKLSFFYNNVELSFTEYDRYVKDWCLGADHGFEISIGDAYTDDVSTVELLEANFVIKYNGNVVPFELTKINKNVYAFK